MKFQFCLLFALFGILLINSNLTAANAVTVSVYYESFCPYCKEFFKEQLIPVYSLYKNKINIELIPSGNTNVMANGQITCQHGPSECFGNAIQACLFARDQNTMQSLHFMVCMYDDPSKNVADKAKNCVETLNLRGWTELYDCANGPTGKLWNKRNRAKTELIRNRVSKFVVPWILINGETRQDCIKNLEGCLAQYIPY